MQWVSWSGHKWAKHPSNRENNHTTGFVDLTRVWSCTIPTQTPLHYCGFPRISVILYMVCVGIVRKTETLKEYWQTAKQLPLTGGSPYHAQLCRIVLANHAAPEPRMVLASSKARDIRLHQMSTSMGLPIPFSASSWDKLKKPVDKQYLKTEDQIIENCNVMQFCLENLRLWRRLHLRG